MPTQKAYEIEGVDLLWTDLLLSSDDEETEAPQPRSPSALPPPTSTEDNQPPQQSTTETTETPPEKKARTEKPISAAATRAPINTLPSRGTRIQRSDAAQKRKAIFLTAPPPPPPGRRGRAAGTRKTGTSAVQIQPACARRATKRTASPPAPAGTPAPRTTAAQPTTETPLITKTGGQPGTATKRATDRATTEPLRIIPPSLPPPIPVELRPGLITMVPHFAVHVSRRYRVRIPEGRWMLRFNRIGQLRACQRLPDDPP
ncbi:mucin-7-like [Odontomachus brunneus]|uniref:mucin-7-like n=1 Tax=Odontomachus brunneus TaxID=486640 RepID=UPI0013F1DF30|nr:mucin-7-like [Odontomachus brunneus]